MVRYVMESLLHRTKPSSGVFFDTANAYVKTPIKYETEFGYANSSGYVAGCDRYLLVYERANSIDYVDASSLASVIDLSTTRHL